MAIYRNIFWPLVMAIAMQGCTTLRVNKAGDGPDSRRGIAYYLPFTQFETKIIWTTSCDKKTNELKIAPSIEATPKTGPDPRGLYVIDYDSLSAFTKTSSIKVDFYESGAIKTINASADDKTGEIANTFVTAAAKLAKIAFIGGGTSITCSSALVDALKTVAGAKDLVDKKTGELKLATNALNAYTARMTREGASVTDDMRSQHSRLIGNVIAMQMELDILKSELDDARKSTTYQSTVLFPSSSGTTATQKGIKVPEEVLRKWISSGQQVAAGEVADSTSVFLDLKSAIGFPGGGDVTVAAPTAPKLAEAKPVSTPPSGGVPAHSPVTDIGELGRPEDGIRYRVPVPGELRMCRGGACAELDEYNRDVELGLDPIKPATELVKTLPVRIVQRETTFYLPFKARAFTNGTLSASFAESGVMTSAGYEQKKAQSEAIAALASTIADQATGLYETARKDDQTELQRIEEAAKLAEARKKLKAAEAALVDVAPDPNTEYVSALASDTALKAAELANLNATIAVEEARRKLAAGGGS